MSVPAKRIITLRSSDHQTFELEEAAAIISPTIKHLIEADVTNPVITIPNVTGQILAMVVAYCQKHADTTAAEDELKRFDWNLLDVDTNTLYRLIDAATCLEMKSLLNLACGKAASLMRGKTPEQSRQIFHITDDITARAEEEMIREMKAWAFHK